MGYPELNKVELGGAGRGRGKEWWEKADQDASSLDGHLRMATDVFFRYSNCSKRVKQ